MTNYILHSEHGVIGVIHYDDSILKISLTSNYEREYRKLFRRMIIEILKHHEGAYDEDSMTVTGFEKRFYQVLHQKLILEKIVPIAQPV